MRIVGNAFKERKNLPTVKPIYLYSILLSSASNTYKRMTNWAGGVTFDGDIYDHYAIKHDSIEEDGSGELQRSKLIVSNVSREFQAIVDTYDGLRNSEVTITQVWKETLGDNTAFISDRLNISNTLITESQVSFSLSSDLDVLDIRIPKRDISRSYFGNVDRFSGFAQTPYRVIGKK